MNDKHKRMIHTIAWIRQGCRQAIRNNDTDKLAESSTRLCGVLDDTVMIMDKQEKMINKLVKRYSMLRNILIGVFIGSISFVIWG